MYYANLMEESWRSILVVVGRWLGRHFARRRGRAMKWGGFNREGERKMKKLLGGKAMYVLLTIAAAATLLSETLKWRPN